jgi:hypothetical protein
MIDAAKTIKRHWDGILWKSAWNFDPRAGGIGVEK